MKNKSLLVLTNSLEIGGTENHLCQVLPRLKANGWDISVYLTVGPGELIAPLEAAGIKVIQPRWYFLPLNFIQLLGYLIRKRPSIVQFMLPRAYLVGGLACIVTGHKTLIMSRRSLNNYQRKYPMLSKIERWLHTKMACIIANNREAIAQLANDEQVAQQKLKLIYNGLDIQRFNNLNQLDAKAIRKQFALNDSALTMLVVANLIPYKGHATLLRALAQIQNQLPSSWQLICVGNKTEYLTELESEARNLNLTANVHWLGKQTSVQPLLAITDMAICCSYEEGFSNAVIEAMAAGLPVIATKVGGNPEAVIDGETGLIVPARDATALATAIASLAADPAQRLSMGAAGKKRVQQLFSLQACVDSYERIYGDLLHGLANV